MAEKKLHSPAPRKPEPDLFDAEERRDLPASLSPSQLSKSRYLRFQLENSVANISGSLSASLNREFETGLGFNLVPIILGLGILSYFIAPAEPMMLAMLLFNAACLFVLTRLEVRGVWFFSIAIGFLLVLGMLVAQTAVTLTATPQLHKQVTGKVTGTVLAVESNRRGAPRYVLVPNSIEGLDRSEYPRTIRLSSSSKKVRYKPGDMISGTARMQSVSGPVYPGGYDFSFFARFRNLGASGFFMGAPKPSNDTATLSVTQKTTIRLNQIRTRIAKRLETALPGQNGKIATALVIGDKTGIPQEVQRALRATGLAHILAISGLHMALVTLTVIWCLRYLVACNPSLALSRPAKKWAAMLGFICATVYLGMSGAGVATQRAWIMISVMLCAVLLDRRAITMRSVAISALLILVIDPTSILSPGFQMSFAAVVSLVAAYEAINRSRQFTQSPRVYTGIRGAIAGAGIYARGLLLTSLIAGLATSFVAAWHFHQVAPLGLLANFLAMPIVTLLVMPGVLLSILLMPFGFEILALYPVSMGIDWIVAIAQWVETLTPLSITGKLHTDSLLLFGSGLVALTVMKTKLRLFCLVNWVAIPIFYQPAEIPSLLIAENGRVAAMKNKRGELNILFPARENFVTEVWGKAFGQGLLPRMKLPKQACNKERCIVTMPESLVLHIVYNPDLLKSSCQRADILIAPRLRWVNCYKREPRLILKRGDFEKYGTHAIYTQRKAEISPVEITVTTAIPEPTRPWHRGYGNTSGASDIGE